MLALSAGTLQSPTPFLLHRSSLKNTHWLYGCPPNSITMCSSRSVILKLLMNDDDGYLKTMKCEKLTCLPLKIVVCFGEKCSKKKGAMHSLLGFVDRARGENPSGRVGCFPQIYPSFAPRLRTQMTDRSSLGIRFRR